MGCVRLYVSTVTPAAHPSGDGWVAWLHPEARAAAALGGTTPRRPRPLHAWPRCRPSSPEPQHCRNGQGIQQAESKGGYLHRAITGAYHYERVKVQR
jgi:hypothetical protein